MKVTVLIATRGRTTSLPHTLESLFCPTNLQAENWEALVIADSDCRDGTTPICEEFAKKFPKHLRVIVQEKTGKSNALNLGIGIAKGEILAFTDDDVIVAPDYIRGIRRVFEEYPADAVQGRILLDCEGGLPSWMTPRMKNFVGWRDYGDQVQDWNDTKYTLFGTSMAVRAEAARKAGGFAPELGAGTAVGYCEDTEFSIRLRQAGCSFFYAPQVVVRHQLPRHRLTRMFFRKRYFGLGRARAYIDAIERVPLWRYGLYSVKYAVLKEAEALWHRLRNRPAEALDAECYAFQNTGFFLQHLRFWLGAPRKLSIVKLWPVEPVNSAEPGAVKASATKL